MAGLFAARVLSEFYPTVTLVERDRLPNTPIQRKGIPQGRHVHGLLSRGSLALDELVLAQSSQGAPKASELPKRRPR